MIRKAESEGNAEDGHSQQHPSGELRFCWISQQPTPSPVLPKNYGILRFSCWPMSLRALLLNFLPSRARNRLLRRLLWQQRQIKTHSIPDNSIWSI